MDSESLRRLLVSLPTSAEESVRAVCEALLARPSHATVCMDYFPSKFQQALWQDFVVSFHGGFRSDSPAEIEALQRKRSQSLDRGRTRSKTTGNQRSISEIRYVELGSLFSEVNRNGHECSRSRRCLPTLLWDQDPIKISGVDDFTHAETDNEHFVNLCMLLAKRPGDDDGAVLRCGLLRYTWETLPGFTLLQNSMAFSPQHRARIQLNGRPFWISAALEVVMRQLRSTSPRSVEPLFVWPICVASDRADCWDSATYAWVKTAATVTIDASELLCELMSLPDLDALKSVRQCRVEHNKSPQWRRFWEVKDARHHNIHQPLDPIGKEKRLVRVRVDVDDPDAPLCLDLEVAGIYTPFFALSYTWGPSFEEEVIQINGQPYKIRKNLYDFLMFFRRNYRRFYNPDMEIPIWIDALCIDQSSNNEKAREVRRMGTIYREAACVLVWLGKEIAELEVPDELWQDGPPSQRKMSVTAKILSESYFRRAWCSQEMILAERMLTFIGRNGTGMLTWDMLRSLYATRDQTTRWFEFPELHTQQLMDDFEAGITRMATLELLKTTLRAGRKLSLLTMLQQTKFCECTNPSDKIYSLWSVASDSEALLKHPDYTMSVESLFLEFTSSWISHYHRLDVLTFAGTSKHTELSIPSWVCDWLKPTHPRFDDRPQWAIEMEDREEKVRRLEIRPILGTYSLLGQLEGSKTLIENVEACRLYNADKGLSAMYCFSSDKQKLLTFAIRCGFISALASEGEVYGGHMHASGQKLNPKHGFDLLRQLFMEFLTGSVGLDRGNSQDQTAFGLCGSQHLHAMILGRHYCENRRIRNMAEVYGTVQYFEAFSDLQTNDPTEYEAWYEHIESSRTGRIVGMIEPGLADPTLSYLSEDESYPPMRVTPGFIGLVPFNAERGDEVVIIPGCRVPLLIRRNASSGEYTLLGECYFQTMMDGDFMPGGRWSKMSRLIQVTLS